jgi:hypothetical protein
MRTRHLQHPRRVRKAEVRSGSHAAGLLTGGVRLSADAPRSVTRRPRWCVPQVKLGPPSFAAVHRQEGLPWKPSTSIAL